MTDLAVRYDGPVDPALHSDIEATLNGIAADLAGSDAVTAAMRYALAAGGKRLRPVLCVEAMSAAGMTPDARNAQLRAACAVEIVHTYSLVHDDLPCMDNDDLRRGQPTTHRVHGSAAAMLAGFALIPFACRTLRDAARDMDVPPDVAAQAVRELCAGAGAAGMVGGQVLDLVSEGTVVSPAGLRSIHAMKTGALFRAALRIGALLAGARPQVVDALGAYGGHVGMAFQIADDVLDETMDSGVLGKTAGKDRDAAKATFLTQGGIDGARDAAAAEVEAALAALAGAGVHSPRLEALARFAADRDR